MIRTLLWALFLCGLLTGGLFHSLGETVAAPVRAPSTNEDAVTMPGNNKGGVAPAEAVPTMTDIHDIKSLEPVLLPMSLLELAAYVLISVLILAVVIIVWLYWRRRKRKAQPVEATLSPEEAAYQRLAILKKEKEISDKEYYFNLSLIFREYLEGRYGIDGLEMTTEELLPRLDRIEIDRTLKHETKEFIATCDPVKFANAGVSEVKKTADFDLLKLFVKKTTVDEQEIDGIDAPHN
jgi:hypothetical protein